MSSRGLSTRRAASCFLAVAAAAAAWRPLGKRLGHSVLALAIARTLVAVAAVGSRAQRA